MDLFTQLLQHPGAAETYHLSAEELFLDEDLRLPPPQRILDMVHQCIEPRDMHTCTIEGELGFSADEPDEPTDSRHEPADQVVQFNRRLPNQPSTWKMETRSRCLSTCLPMLSRRDTRCGLVAVTSGNTHPGVVFRLCVRNLAPWSPFRSTGCDWDCSKAVTTRHLSQLSDALGWQCST